MYLLTASEVCELRHLYLEMWPEVFDTHVGRCLSGKGHLPHLRWTRRKTPPHSPCRSDGRHERGGPEENHLNRYT